MVSFLDRLAGRRPILLDGATAAELQRRDVAVTAPLWTSLALVSEAGRAVVRQIHREYIEAGAEVITANTFRTNLRTLARAGLDDRAARQLVQVAIGEAHAARREAGVADVAIAASVAPVEDCYHPELTPDNAALHDEHHWMMRSLAETEIDLVLLETMCTVRETVIALDHARRCGLTACVSFVCEAGGRVLSGEPLRDAVAAIAPLAPAAILINCTELAAIPDALAALRDASRLPLGVYPNIEDRSGIAPRTAVNAYVPPGCDEESFAAELAGWVDAYGIAIVGGCCGTTPAHIRALCTALAAR